MTGFQTPQQYIKSHLNDITYVTFRYGKNVGLLIYTISVLNRSPYYLVVYA